MTDITKPAFPSEELEAKLRLPTAEKNGNRFAISLQEKRKFDRHALIACRLLKGAAALALFIDKNELIFHGIADKDKFIQELESFPKWNEAYHLCLLAAHEPLLVNDLRQYVGEGSTLEIPDIDIFAFAGVPLAAKNDGLQGVLCVVDKHPQTWSKEDLASLEEVALTLSQEIDLRQEIKCLQTAEAWLLGQKQTMMLAMEGGRIGTFEWDIENNFIIWSESLEKMMGLAPGEFKGTIEHFSSMVHPLDKEKVKKAIEESIKSGNEYRCEFRMLHPDFGVRWTETRGFIVRNADGKAIRMHGVDVDITERVLIEQRLRQTEEGLLLASETANFGIHDYDAIADKATWTPKLYTLTGVAPETIITFEIATDIIHPEDRDRIKLAMQKAMDPKGNGEFEENFRIVRPDNGVVRWLHNKCRTFFIEKNGIKIAARNTGVIHDITEQKQATEQLKLAAERMELTQKSASATLYELNLQSGEAIRHASFENLTGHSLEETPKTIEGWKSIIFSEDADEVWPQMLEGISSRKGYSLEYRVLHKSGRELWIHDRAKVLKNDSDGSWRVLGMAIDITDKKKVEQELIQSRELFLTLATMLPVGIFRTDAEGRCTYVNKRWCEISQLSPDQAKGTGWTRALPPEDKDQVLFLWQNAVKNKQPFEAEYKFSQKNGGYAWLYGQAVCELGKNGEVVGYIGAVTDISDRKRSEEALHRYAEQLKKADKNKDNFLALIAHELRNPLSPILNAVQVMRVSNSAKVNPNKMLDLIERQVNHLTHLVNDLLDVSRVRQGKVTLNIDKVDIFDVVQSAADLSRPLIDSRHHTLILDTPSRGKFWVNGDFIRLTQSLSNLLNNAAKYTDEGGIIELSGKAAENNFVLTVQDNGTGIPSDLLPYIFDLFTQADHSQQRSQGGLGIGLAVVKILVTLHGGRVAVESEGPNRGSKFTIILPTTTAPLHQSLSPQNNNPPHTPGKRVLIVDDDADSRESLGIFLEMNGHLVARAKDASNALLLAATFDPQICLLDIGLPDIDGYELAKLLRQGRISPFAKLIALTGFGQRQDIRHSKEAGFDCHLLKPVEPNQIISLIGSL